MYENNIETGIKALDKAANEQLKNPGVAEAMQIYREWLDAHSVVTGHTIDGSVIVQSVKAGTTKLG